MGKVKFKEEIKEEIEDLDKRMEQERVKQDGTRLGVLDLVTEKVISRKLLVWVTATTLLATSLITAEEWAAITLGYVGVEGFADLAVKWKKG